MVITATHVSIGLAVITILVGLFWNVHSIFTTKEEMINTIRTGQEIAKVREKQKEEDIKEIKVSLEKIMNGESKCKLQFERRISKIEQKSDSIQKELDTLKT